MEHIIPTVRGGSTTADNLALSCSGCNGHKYDKIEGQDPISQSMAPLFHPRHHTWSEHFAWTADYSRVIGLTPTGRATVETLHLNREGVVNLRRVLFLAVLHPPEETECAL